MPSRLLSWPRPRRSSGSLRLSLLLYPASRSFTTAAPMIRFQLAPTLHDGLFDADVNARGMTVCELLPSAVCREYRTYTLSRVETFQSTFASNWSVRSVAAVVPR